MPLILFIPLCLAVLWLFALAVDSDNQLGGCVCLSILVVMCLRESGLFG